MTFVDNVYSCTRNASPKIYSIDDIPYLDISELVSPEELLFSTKNFIFSISMWLLVLKYPTKVPIPNSDKISSQFLSKFSLIST